jgi:hypothetical protein
MEILILIFLGIISYLILVQSKGVNKPTAEQTVTVDTNLPKENIIITVTPNTSSTTELAKQIATQNTATSTEAFSLYQAYKDYSLLNVAHLQADREAQTNGASTSTGWVDAGNGCIIDPVGNPRYFGYRELPDGTKVYPYTVDSSGRLVANPQYFGGT